MRSTPLASITRRRGRVLTAAVGVIALGAALAGCTTNTTSATTNASPAAGGDTASGGSGINIAVMGGAASDPFWATVKNGGQAAGKVVEGAGGKVTFVAMPNYNNFNNDAAKLVANILALKPSAAIIPDWSPEAQNANIKALTSAGIPVFIYNTGKDQLSTLGGVSYVGSDPYQSGKAAGQELTEASSKHPICINTLAGTVTGEQFCSGLKAGNSGSTILSLPSSQFGDPTSVAQAIKGALLKDSTIDGVYTNNAGDATSAASAISQAGSGSKVKVVSQNFDDAGLARIQKGTQLAAIDQQGYAQGYYAVSSAFQYVAYGIKMPDIATGPSVINKSNIADALKGLKLGTR